jgi:Rab guanine nucleotide exchange factor SEC2
MVAAARKETQETERRNEQLKSQLKDTEDLLASQQEQLQDLKAVMEKLSERDENETTALQSTAPSTPGLAAQDKMSRIFESNNSPAGAGPEDIPPNHPLHFSHLVHPILRNDLQNFTDFTELLQVSKSRAPSRAGSGNYGGLNIMGLGVSHGNASSSSLSNIITSPTTPVGPSNSSTAAASPSMPSPAFNLPPLKDTKFYKRAVAEDIEPTLRLDAAPGLSWLTRRNVISSMAAGNLVVEPHPPVNKFYGPVYSCSLCGERRKAEKYARRHRFRVSEAENADRYPLCDYCLGRVRTSCDYMGFLRMVKDGHWRADSEEEIQAAYEECVRLRERMFWARLGGGVVPSLSMREMPRSPSIPVPPSRPSVESENLNVSKAREDPFTEAEKEHQKQVEKALIEDMTTTAPPPEKPASESASSDRSSSPASLPQSTPDDEIDAAAAQQLQSEDAKAMPPPPVPEKSESEQTEADQATSEKSRPASTPRRRSSGGDSIVARALAKFDVAGEKPIAPVTITEEPQKESETPVPGSFP